MPKDRKAPPFGTYSSLEKHARLVHPLVDLEILKTRCLFVSVERSSSPVNSLQQTTVSGGSGVVGRSRRFRTTPRMRVGNGPWHQLASRTGGYPPRQTQNIIGQI
ncbi:hypothetical protein Acr_11g0013490 [Actinidia rufa]|uniref:Uncharacterized protein n=1 Tax=Actinidia rufa TaxID=165716 RepID=A0A7J0FEK6_9ERIC|nr:hypothetical protein Acr_11g0013490 [Actinidia rufa]